jgi:hypothetical protein
MLLAGQVSNSAAQIKQSTQQQHSSSQNVLGTAHSLQLVAEEITDTAHQVSINSILLEDLTVQLNGVLTQIRLAA